MASEGPLGRNRRLVGYDELEVLVARVLAAVVVGALLLIAHRYLAGPAAQLPLPFQVGVDSIRSVAIAGMTAVPVVGVPLAWWARSGYLGESIAADADIPLLYLVWAVTTMILM